MQRRLILAIGACLFALPASGAETVRRVDERFASPDAAEVPDFQKHVVPLLGRLGCNGRACHGSFQGQGGFRLSLFGYDFKMDHDNLTTGDSPHVDIERPAESLMLQKPTLAVAHKGEKRLESGSWQYRVLVNWIQAGAKGLAGESPQRLQLQVTPAEIQFQNRDETVQLRAEAVWSDGTREDVTPLCRFQTNDDQVTVIDANGLVTARGTGDTHVVVFYDNAVEPVPVLRPVTDKTAQSDTQAAATPIDEFVVGKLRRLGIIPSELCSDAEFLRRSSLDITGTLPPAHEVEAFLADASPDKRSRKIDELLERPTYAAWWTTFLCDLTGNNPQKLNNVGVTQGSATREWYDWIHQRVSQNVSYDQIVSGIVVSVSRMPDEGFREYCQAMADMNKSGSDKSYADRPTMPYYWARQNFRSPNERALGFAYAFLGLRIQCAECHKHPFDQWSQDDFKEFAGFFGRVAYGKSPDARKEYDAMMEELGMTDKKGNKALKELARLVKEGKPVPAQEVFVTPPGKGGQRPKGEMGKSKPGPVKTARLLGGSEVPVARLADPRTALMDWLRDRDNPYFARAFVNRVWARYFPTGIIEPPDDLSRANPPSNGPLLDYLAREFISRNYDMKWLHREIANSQTYQRSWKPNDTNRLDERNFSHALPRRLPAEVAYDAIRQVTASDEEVARMQSDPSIRAIGQARPDGKGKKGFNNYALQIFGKSLRESNCDCDRSMEPSLLQTIYVQNDSDTLNLIEQSRWVSDALKPAGKGASQPAGEDANAGQIAGLSRKLEKARASGDAQAVARLEKRLASVRKKSGQTSAAEPAENSESESKSVAKFDRPELIRQAYLRSLGRPPEARELERAAKFINDASSPATGLRGLLWALLNTKEFIVNH
jgi:hypothetical protein